MRGRRHALRGAIVLALLAGLVAPGALVGPARAQDAGRRPPRSPVVVDANGQVVGAAFGVGVRVQVGGRIAFLRVGRGQFQEGHARVLYESPDCSGPAFLRLTTPPGTAAMLGEVGVGAPNVLLAPGGPLETRTVRSGWDARVAPPTCVSVSAVALEVAPADTLMDLGVFTPPFRVE